MKFLNSFKYAFAGINAAKVQRNFIIEFCSAILVIAAGFYFHISNIEWCLVSLCCGAVLSAEIFNTAIEYIIDKISPESNKEAGLIKDLAAGAVLVISMAAAAVGLIIFLKYL